MCLRYCKIRCPTKVGQRSDYEAAGDDFGQPRQRPLLAGTASNTGHSGWGIATARCESKRGLVRSPWMGSRSGGVDPEVVDGEGESFLLVLNC